MNTEEEIIEILKQTHTKKGFAAQAIDRLCELVEREKMTTMKFIAGNDLIVDKVNGIPTIRCDCEAKHRQQLEELEKWVEENKEPAVTTTDWLGRKNTTYCLMVLPLLSKIKEMRSNG